MQGELLVAVDDRVTCVVAALVANDVIVIAGDKIGDLAFAFIAPLGSDEYRPGHCFSFRRCAGTHPLNASSRKLNSIAETAGRNAGGRGSPRE